MNSDLKELFRPFSIGSLTIANRIVMAPMTRGFSPQGVPGKMVADYYKRRAENHVGLIITEGTFVNHPAAASGLNQPDFHGDQALQGWTEVVRSVHEAGGKIVPQLWHVGMARKAGNINPNQHSLPIGPSGIDLETELKVGQEMTVGEISQVVEAFAQAARDARRLGFDGIEIHGAHGYLIDQFFWEKTNQRQDRYGGDITSRASFAAEIITACRQAVGPDFPIIFRFSQWKIGKYQAKTVASPDELKDLLSPLVQAGVDVFHCSTRRCLEPEFAGSSLNLAGWTKKLTGKPTITVGSVGLDHMFMDKVMRGNSQSLPTLAPLIKRLMNNEFDLIAVGRALLADPAWVTKIAENRIEELIAYEPGCEKTLS